MTGSRTLNHNHFQPKDQITSGNHGTVPLLPFVIATLFWTATIAALGFWHYDRVAAGFLETAAAAARQSIEKDKIYRLWAAEHGGVYVPTTDRTPPNPYLEHVFERDLTTPSGRPLTLVNPAYMTRQVHELASERFGSRSKITSLKPLRPENQPDDWETEALGRFVAGETEYAGLELLDGTKFLRMMSPFHTEAPCLRCHGLQGYQVGDLIGGISVAIDWQPYQLAHRKAWAGYGFGYGGVWILGLMLLENHRRRLRLYLEQRRQTEQGRREMLEHLQKLAAHLPGMIYQFQLKPDGTSCLPYASDALDTIYGVRPDEVKEDAAPIFAAVHPQDRDQFELSIRHSADTLEVWSNQHRVMHPSGKTLWVEGHSTPERLADGSTLWHGYAQDISARKQAEELLEQQQKQLKHRNRTLTQFSYAVSHELKTPLVTIEASLGMIQQSLQASPDAGINRMYDYARNAARRMNHLLESLLQMFRIEKSDNPVQDIDFGEMIRDIINQLTRENKLHGVTVNVVGTDLVLRGDRDNIVLIWRNLIDNAAKYMGEQSHPTIEVGAEDIGRETIFYVRDNGIGIEKAYQERIFGLFDQLNKNAAGNGLGLPLVQRIVEYYGGSIRVESAGTDQGSCFYFTLPDIRWEKKATS